MKNKMAPMISSHKKRGVVPLRVPLRPKRLTADPGPMQIAKDCVVVEALSCILGLEEPRVRTLMRRWKKSILKASLNEENGRLPSRVMLATAQKQVICFLEAEESRGPRSHVVQAFYLASRESSLKFDWSLAKERVRRAKLDSTGAIDSWKGCFAMVTGESNAKSEIYVCGTRKLTLRSLTSLICHESLHNLAKRTRSGNPWLGEETEHLAMAFIGDPQLVDTATLAMLNE